LRCGAAPRVDAFTPHRTARTPVVNEPLGLVGLHTANECLLRSHDKTRWKVLRSKTFVQRHASSRDRERKNSKSPPKFTVNTAKKSQRIVDRLTWMHYTRFCLPSGPQPSLSRCYSATDLVTNWAIGV